MQIKKTTAFLMALLFIVAGYAIRYITESRGNKKTTDSFAPQQLREMDVDSLHSVKNNLEIVLQQKDSLRIDTLKMLGRTKDSLLFVAGQINANFRIIKDAKVLDQLDSTLSVVKDLISASNKIIMDETIDMLRPTNVALRNLIKDIKVHTEKLQNVAKNIQTVSDIVNGLTAIIGSPIFKVVSKPVSAS